MKRTYRSKVEYALALPIAAALIITGVIMVIRQNWLLAALVALVGIFILYIYRASFYELTGDNKLKIKIGFFYEKEIYVRSIKKVRPTRNHHASPALSTDRLEISFNRYERVMISPDHKLEFIKELRERNPKILVD